jgi:translation initiation factor IF-3
LAEFGPVRRGTYAEGGQLADKDLRINEQIRVREVRLIDDKGEQKGIISTLEALRMARELGLDLVEVAPQSLPPVCKLLNYGKFKFEQEKKVKDSRKKAKVGELKEIRMQPKIAGHDLDFKSGHVREFLEQGFKVKVTIRFRGRELAHTEIGEQVLGKVLSRIEGYYILERSPLMEGRFMSMVLQPKLSIIKKQAADEAAPADSGQP